MPVSFFDDLPHTNDLPADISAFLTAAGKTGTLAHIRQVVEQARALAVRFGGDVDAAATAAWCHDLAVVVPRSQMIAVAEAWGVPLTDSDRAIPLLIHGPLAAEVARRRLGITDEDTLNAIRYHSTLRAGASLLEQVVFTADKVALDPISPRSDFLPALRAALDKGIGTAAFVYLDWVLRNAGEMGWTIHDNVRAAHAELAG